MPTSKTTTAKKPASKTAQSKMPEIQIIESEIISNSLLPYNPLIQSPVITVDEENEQRVEFIEEAQSLAVLNKQVLEAKRRQVELEVDNKKLDAANKIIDGINDIADKALTQENIMKILAKQDLNPMDMKFLAESMDKMANTLKSLMNPSVQDEFGNRKRTKIMAQFQTPSGEKATMAVEVDNGD